MRSIPFTPQESQRSLFAAAALLLGAAQGVSQEFAPGHLFVTTQFSDGVLEFDEAGSFVRLFADDIGIQSPTRLAFGPDGNLYVGDQGADRVFVVDAAGAKVRELTNAQLTSAIGIAFGPNGHVFVSSATNDRVVEFTLEGTFVRSIGVGSGLDLPGGLCFGPNGHLYVVSGNTDRVLEFDPQGALLRELGVGAGQNGIGDVLVNSEGHLLVATETTNTVLELDAFGAKVGEFGNAVIGQAAFCMALRADGRVLVGDGSDDIVVFDEAGVASPTIDVPAAEGANSVVLGIAFAPHRFEARIVGKLQRAGAKTIARQEKGILSWYPGSADAFLALEDSASADDFASASGRSLFALHGLALRDDAPAKRARFTGTELGDGAVGSGWASLSLNATGKPVAGLLAPARLLGRFEWASPGVAFSAIVTTTKPKKP